MSLNYFDAIAYINLKHRKDRNSHILKELCRLKVNNAKIKRFEGNYIPFNGHLGCVLSHIDVVQWAIEEKLNNILILEDDCYFIDDIEFLNSTIEYFFKIVKKWDVFLFGGFYEKIEKSEYPYINRIKQSYRSHCYAINKNYFENLKNNFLTSSDLLKNCDLHFDVMNFALDRNWLSLQEKDLWYASNILLAAQLADYSDIGWQNKNKR
jgi:glycosyl transferase, family 25